MKMAANSANIDVIIENISDRVVPQCEHGPALLFAKYSGKNNGRRFYSCSACRDRKDCNLFHWEDEWNKKKHQDSIDKGEHTEHDILHKHFRKRLKKFRKLPTEERRVCQSCGCLLLPGEERSHKNQGHTLETGIKDRLLKTPTKLLWAKDDNKTLAQYLFSERTVDFILSALKDLHITHVLCVGAPKIHETIQKLHTEGSYMDSMLLDLDTRYMQFYSEQKFYKYNMFNNHFFGRNEEALDKFLTLSQGKNVIMVTDPPFGGMVQALAESVKKFKIRYSELNADFCNNNELPVLWFFPYFMEPKMKEYLPDFSMLDYKVDYNNHLLYKEGKKERGSPVRIFTNVEPSKVIHPNAEGYWYCDVCKRYSAKENLHCDICGVCPSKDGRTYRHCYDCERCVKPNKVHCKTCGRCDFPDHKCGVTPTGCHICGNLEHKRRDCPQKDRKQDRLAMKRYDKKVEGADKIRHKICPEKVEFSKWELRENSVTKLMKKKSCFQHGETKRKKQK